MCVRQRNQTARLARRGPRGHRVGEAFARRGETGFRASLAEAPARPNNTDNSREPIASWTVTSVPDNSSARYSQTDSIM